MNNPKRNAGVRRVQYVKWTCPVCRQSFEITPGEAATRESCSRKCYWNSPARQRRRTRGLQRIMFVYGYTKAEALAFMRGHVAGRNAEWQAIKRGKNLTQRKVGSQGWEADADSDLDDGPKGATHGRSARRRNFVDGPDLEPDPGLQ